MMKNTLRNAFSTLLIAAILTGCGTGSPKIDDVSVSGSFSSADSQSVSAGSESTADPNSSASDLSSSEKSSNDISSESQTVSTSDSSDNATTTYSDDVPVVVFLGDSQFANGAANGTAIADYVESMTYSHVYNLGCGGMMASMPEPGADGQYDANFVNVSKFLSRQMPVQIYDRFPEVEALAETLDPQSVDFYVVEYGGNDFINAKALSGEPGDETAYLSAMQIGIDNLRKASPNARIILCSPVYAEYHNPYGESLGNTFTYSNTFGAAWEYAANCCQLGNNNDCIVFDATSTACMDIGLNTASQYLEADGIHLSRPGRHTFAAVIAHFIDRELGRPTMSLDGNNYKIQDYMTKEEKNSMK